jgi:peptidase M28-like protein
MRSRRAGLGPAYYSPAMEAARPPRRRRRPRRGTVERPVNARLVRAASILVAPAILAVLFSVSATGTLPRPTLEPLFDAAAASTLATELATDYPARVPGTPEAAEAALWFKETVSSLGFATEEDRWTEDLPDLGRVELRNVVAVIPGKAEEAVLVVAHRDNAGASQPYGDNASGTAALIELARGYAPNGSLSPPQPQRTLVLVSTDAGAFGGAGAARFARTSPYADGAFAAIVLDGLGGVGRPRIVISGDKPKSPAPAFVRTAAARLAEQVGVEPALPNVVAQLVDFGVPYAGGEQGRFLARGVAALTLTTDEHGDPNVPAGDAGGVVDGERLGRMGKAAEALLGNIDSSVGAPYRTPDSVFLGQRVASGWTIRLMLLVAVVPFALGAVDLLVRGRRRGLPLRPAWRALRTRGLVWLYAGILLWLAVFVGILPTGAPYPPPPWSSVVTDWPVAGLGLVAIALFGGWFVARRRLAAVPNVTTAEERLAGYAVGLTWLAVVAVTIGLVRPYALLFVLPSLYTWLWLPLWARGSPRVGLFLLGFAGPIVGLVVLGIELGLSFPDTVLYVLGLATLGYVPASSVVFALAWATAAAQLGALAFGRYAPYAAGAEPPPAGTIRATLRAAGRRSWRRYPSEM